jgi:hypothetical protein
MLPYLIFVFASMVQIDLVCNSCNENRDSRFLVLPPFHNVSRSVLANYFSLLNVLHYIKEQSDTTLGYMMR